MSHSHHTKIKDLEEKILKDFRKHESLSDVILLHPKLKVLFITFLICLLILSSLEAFGIIKGIFSGDFKHDTKNKTVDGKLLSPEEYAHYAYLFSGRAVSPGYEKVQKFINKQQTSYSKDTTNTQNKKIKYSLLEWPLTDHTRTKCGIRH